jgi:hypothetical protein
MNIIVKKLLIYVFLTGNNGIYINQKWSSSILRAHEWLRIKKWKVCVENMNYFNFLKIEDNFQKMF